jgi:hypothetical protein
MRLPRPHLAMQRNAFAARQRPRKFGGDCLSFFNGMGKYHAYQSYSQLDLPKFCARSG